MRHRLLVAVAALTLVSTAAQASSELDPVDDFLPTFVGDHDADLDVTAFSVNYDAGTQIFTLGATFAGDVNPGRPGLYVIGANTGTGVNRPFAGIGAPNVIFNRALVIQKTGAGVVSGNPFTATIAGNTLTALIPLAFLPSTGFAPELYGFNIWPRNGVGSNSQIADFAPNNSTLASVPEPATWSMLLTGFFGLGATLRRQRAGKARLIA